MNFPLQIAKLIVTHELIVAGDIDPAEAPTETYEDLVVLLIDEMHGDIHRAYELAEFVRVIMTAELAEALR
jgi:hypothetical protein